MSNSSIPKQSGDLCIAEAAELLRARDLSSVEITRACLERIDARNGELRAFITVTAESALEQARAADEEMERGIWRGPLHGIPIALKDLLDTAGVRTTAASALFAERVPQTDAAVVRKLRHSGAVLIGKTNLHEFAYGCSSVVTHFGAVRNARNAEHIAGGSSSGSAVAVADGMCLGAIGTDTAGSIRLPAAYCGIVGLKPTYGRVSAAGVIPLSWPHDHVGPMTQSVEDAALMLQAIAGFDSTDTTSVDVTVPDFVAEMNAALGSVRFGVARKFFFDDLDEDIARVTEHAVAAAHRLGEVCDVELPVCTDRTVQAAEAYAYHREWAAKSPEKYEAETLRRINFGARFSAAEYIDGVRELQRLRHEAEDVFANVDVIITPTTPRMPARIDDLLREPESLRERELTMLRNTRPFNALGLPTISIPCGNVNGLPIGIQLAAASWQEGKLLRVAKALEEALKR